MILETFMFNESEFSDIDSVLRRRGHLIVGEGDRSKTFSPYVDEEIDVGNSELSFARSDERYADAEQYLTFFAKDSFRKLLRRLTTTNEVGVSMQFLAKTVEPEALESYISLLVNSGHVYSQEGYIFLRHPIDNIGPSLEQYIAEICVRELRGSAAWGVKLDDLPKSGGDFDVLTWLEPSLLYIECKSSAPRNIDRSQIANYLQREFELAADLSIFMIDTDEKLDLFIEQIFDPIVKKGLGSTTPSPLMKPLASYPGIFGGYRCVFVTNTQPSILRQIRRCLKAYYALQRHRLVSRPKPETDFTAVLRSGP